MIQDTKFEILDENNDWEKFFSLNNDCRTCVTFHVMDIKNNYTTKTSRYTRTHESNQDNLSCLVHGTEACMHMWFDEGEPSRNVDGIPLICRHDFVG